MYYYKFRCDDLNLEGSINFGRRILNCEKRAAYECPHVMYKDNTYFTRDNDWVYILEDMNTSEFAIFCAKCAKEKVSIVEIE